MKELKPSFKLLFTGIGIILFWRGIWMAADTYLFVDSPNISIIVSLLIGIVIIVWMKHKTI